MSVFDFEARQVFKVAAEQKHVVRVIFDVEDGDGAALRGGDSVFNDVKTVRTAASDGFCTAIEGAGHG